ncbi:nuclear transport factor 2 family protein [Streptomyces sp. NPDC002896]|uniref:nuclear transport factor 2 family protein n=1 Tax=Streptomyces sp. NPDC002896 TaxID=3154438 RepID=UPI0033349E80
MSTDDPLRQQQEVPAQQAVLLHRMYEVFSTDEREAVLAVALAPDVDWPNVLDGVRLHGHEEVRAYWARQFAAGTPLVRLEGLRLDEKEPGAAASPGGSRKVVGTVRTGMRDETGDHWADAPVEHVYSFTTDGRVSRMDVRQP